MATLNGVEVAPCGRCSAPLGANAYTITKNGAEARRIFCDPCAELTAQVYELKPIGRRARATRDDEGPPVADASTSRKSKEA